ncbi:ATP-binding cassette domain-containing protein [Streptomyces erythrochromogenes]|uniref:ATP-binding cassette domain-containing protein n=1 Tax=Streptomyces erythrochromogenes TaxID=285574 RepID=UPI00382DCE37
MTLRLNGIGFRYTRSTTVFDGFNLTISSPATVLLGPNGAGKSTLMGIAATHLQAERGTVSWRDKTPAGRRETVAYVRAVAWLPQEIVAIPGLTVREQVAYMGWLKGMSRSAAWEASQQALERVRLTDLANRRSHQLSGGQKRRMGLAGALTHRSELILMDEPTAGLDPTQRKIFRGLLDSLRGDVHIVVSTHQTEDLADSYSEVVVLDRGTVRFQGPTEEFHSLAGDTAAGPRERAEAAYAQLVRGEV